MSCSYCCLYELTLIDMFVILSLNGRDDIDTIVALVRAGYIIYCFAFHAVVPAHFLVGICESKRYRANTDALALLGCVL